MKTIFWDTEPCSLVEVYRRFRGAYCLIIRATSHYRPGAEAVSTSETSIKLYETTRTTRLNISEDSHLQLAINMSMKVFISCFI
jgi:hypothetical protein